MSSGYIWQPTESTNQSLKFAKGINGLPDELLVEIIKWSLDDPDTSPGILRISLLNRRFRFIALNTPSLWTKVPRIGGEFYDSFIERSQKHLLDVTIKIKKSYSSDEIKELDSTFFNLVNRWKALTVLWPRENLAEDQDSPLVGPILSRFRSLKLSFLETFRYSIYGGPRATILDPLDDPIYDIYIGWEAPKLRKITMEGFSPFSFDNKMESVTDVTINIDIVDDLREDYLPKEIYLFFLSVPSVERLRLTVTKHIDDDDNVDSPLAAYSEDAYEPNVAQKDTSDDNHNHSESEDPVTNVASHQLLEYLTGEKNSSTLEVIGTGCSKLADDVQIENAPDLEDEIYSILGRQNEGQLIDLDNLKYLEFDLDSSYDMFHIMRMYSHLSTPNVEELVFKISNSRRNKDFITELHRKRIHSENVCFAENLNLLFENYLFRTTWDTYYDFEMSSLKRLFISIDNPHSVSCNGDCMYSLPLETMSELEHLEIEIFDLKPDLSNLSISNLKTIRLSGYPSYVITRSLYHSLKRCTENMGVDEDELDPKQFVLDINECTCSETYREATKGLFDTLGLRKAIKLEWNTVQDNVSPVRTFLLERLLMTQVN